MSRGKTWEGSDPKCAFSEFSFSDNNWNCAAMNILRDLAETQGYSRRVNDESIGVVPLEHGYIVLVWYKERGRIGNAIYMVDGEELRQITIEDVNDAVSFYRYKT